MSSKNSNGSLRFTSPEYEDILDNLAEDFPKLETTARMEQNVRLRNILLFLNDEGEFEDFKLSKDYKDYLNRPTKKTKDEELICRSKDLLITFFDKLKQYQTLCKYAPTSSKCNELRGKCADLREESKELIDCYKQE